MAYGQSSVGSYGMDTLFASQKFIREVSGITVSSGQNLKRGCLVALVSGEYVAYNSGASDGSEVIAGVLAVDVDATSADAKGNIYVSGIFNKEQLTDSGASGSTISAGLYAYNQIEIVEEGV
jgi:hypothetical protein